MKYLQNIRKHFDVMVFIYVLYLVGGSYICDKNIVDLCFIIGFSILYLAIKLESKKV